MAEEYVKQGDLGQPEPIPGKPGQNRDKPEFRVILIGKTGVGKSCLGNSILGERKFKYKLSPASVTQYCMRARADRFERDVQVIDTPGLFDISTPIEELKTNISRCLALSLPGPHAFLFVSSIISRFTPEDQATISQFAKIFGERFFRFAVVVFTCEDDLRWHENTIDEFLQDAPIELKTLLEKCGNRHVCFDNRAQQEEKDSRCQKLIEIVDTMQASNEEKFFSNKIYSHVMKPFEKDSESTLSDCRKDRDLPRNQQMEKRTQYREELQAMRTNLDSHMCKTETFEFADSYARTKLLELRFHEVEAALAYKEFQNDVLRGHVEAIENQRTENMRSKGSGKGSWLMDLLMKLVTALVMKLM